MAKTVVQTVLAALLACSVLAPARGGVVSLSDVTGTTPRPQIVEQTLGSTLIGYQEPATAPGRRPGQGVVSLTDVTGLRPEQQAASAGGYGYNAYVEPSAAPPRPGYGYFPSEPRPAPPRPQGGVVSLTDVTGVAPQYLGPAPPQPRPLHPEQGYDPQRPYSPCYVPGAGPAYSVPQHPANAVHLGGVRLPRSPRSKRSPQHGSVRLEDVAGPGAGRYPSYGPPAYVRPAYGYNNYWYGRPRPYYNYNYNVVPVPLTCFDLTADGWVAHRPVVPVSEQQPQHGRDRESLQPAEWSRPAHRQPGASEKLIEIEQHDDRIPPEFIRRR